MVDAIQALLQREAVVVVQVFHQPAYLAGQEQVKVVLIDLEHVILRF